MLLLLLLFRTSYRKSPLALILRVLASFVNSKTIHKLLRKDMNHRTWKSLVTWTDLSNNGHIDELVETHPQCYFTKLLRLNTCTQRWWYHNDIMHASWFVHIHYWLLTHTVMKVAEPYGVAHSFSYGYELPVQCTMYNVQVNAAPSCFPPPQHAGYCGGRTLA